MDMFEWNKERYPFNILNADTMKTFGDAEKVLWDGLTEYENENAAEGKLTADGIMAECGMIDTFFDTLFGAGVSGTMFPEKHDMGARVKAVKKLYRLRGEQLRSHAKNVDDIQKLVKGA